jgi:hypothetical protein
MHLEPDQIERYFARELSPADRVAVSEHLAACPECRTRIASNPKFRTVAASAVTELTGVQPGKNLPKLLFGPFRGRERLALDMREQLACVTPSDTNREAVAGTSRKYLELLSSIFAIERP